MGIFFGQNRNSELPVPTTSNIKYGRLYNWYAASNPLFAPVGWHLASNTEWNTLFATIGGNPDELHYKMKEIGLTYWQNTTINVTNESNFSMRGSGWRSITQFENLKITGILWRSTPSSPIPYPPTYTTNYPGAYYTIFGTDGSGANEGYMSSFYYINAGIGARFVKDDPIDPNGLIDIDGNTYRTVKYGDQVWMIDNWACTKLNNGDPIPNVTDNTAWAALITGAYCDYNNDVNNVFL